jgi:ribosomal protein S18 acetylase RimI-like enzyme
MEFRPVTPTDYEPLRQFLSEVGWQHRVSDAEQFNKMMEHTNRTVVALDGSRIIGFARALCDEVSNGYISMVAVAPEQRGRGIGRELIQRLTNDDDAITWVLRAGRDSSGFWEKTGFKSSDIAMEKIRL